MVVRDFRRYAWNKASFAQDFAQFGQIINGLTFIMMTDEMTGTTLNDRFSGRTLTLPASTMWSSIGKFGSALDFSSQSAATGSDAGLPASSADFGVSFWFKTTSANFYDNMFQYGTDGQFTKLRSILLGGGQIVPTNYGTSLTGSGTWNDGKWHHLMMTTLNGIWTWWVDGRQDGSGSLGLATVLGGATALKFGGTTGQFDLLKFWSRNMKMADAVLDYTEPFAIWQPCLIDRLLPLFGTPLANTERQFPIGNERGTWHQ